MSEYQGTCSDQCQNPGHCFHPNFCPVAGKWIEENNARIRSKLRIIEYQKHQQERQKEIEEYHRRMENMRRIEAEKRAEEQRKRAKTIADKKLAESNTALGISKIWREARQKAEEKRSQVKRLNKAIAILVNAKRNQDALRDAMNYEPIGARDFAVIMPPTNHCSGFGQKDWMQDDDEWDLYSDCYTRTERLR
jgi:hypothetical protein